MGKSFNLNILNEQGSLYTGKVVSLVVPSQTGYLGVLANHAPLIANLTFGRITTRDDAGNNRVFHVKESGVIEVLRNDVTILLCS